MRWKPVACCLLLLSTFAWARTQTPAPSVLLQQADDFSAAQDYIRARTAYEKILKAGETLPPTAKRNLGEAYLKGRPSNPQSAAMWLSEALRADESNEGTRALLADALARSGNYVAAIEHYRLLAERHPESPEYTLGLISVLKQTGQTDTALTLGAEILDKFPALSSVRLEYARLLTYRKQYAEARRQFELLLRRDPNSIPARIGLAKTHSWEGNQEAALTLYNKVLERHPRSYDALVGKAFSLLWIGQSGEARRLLSQAHRRQPEDTEVADALRGLGGPLPISPVKSPLAKLQPQSGSTLPERLNQAQQRKPSPQTQKSEETLPARVVTSGDSHHWIGIIAAIVLLFVLARKRMAAEHQTGMNSSKAAPTPPAPPHPNTERPAPLTQTVITQSELATGASVQTDAVDQHTSASVQAETPPVRNHHSELLKGRLLLLVGADSNVVEVERRYLARHSAEIVVLHNWADAMTWLDSREPDAIVVNSMTSDDWSGARMYQWLRDHHPRLAHRTIVALGFPDPGLDSSAGCMYHPLTGSELVAAVKGAVQHPS